MDIITGWKSSKWETLRYFSNEMIVLAIFSEEDYFKDTAGFTDHLRNDNPVWYNSYIGEDISREFDFHAHRKKAVWMNLISNVTPSDIKFLFSFLSQRPLTEGTLFPLTFEHCSYCEQLKWVHIHDFETHLIPGGQTCNECASYQYTEEEKTENFSQTIITGL